MKVSSSKVHGAIPGVDPGATNKVKAEELARKSHEKRVTNSASEKVQLSQKLLDMNKIKELATPTDAVDEAKVARLQKLIDEGKYKVDAESVADRLVNEHLNMR